MDQEQPARELKRKIVEVPISWGERDQGQVFEITEMSAPRAEKWAWSMALVLKGTKAEIPEADYPLGAVGVMVRGVNAFLGADIDIEKLWPLLEELMTCVKIIRNPDPDRNTGRPVTHPLLPNDIYEPKTLTWLRQEVLSLHVGFSILDALSAWISAIKKHPASKSTPTSDLSSDTASPAEKSPQPT
jgi:hypothetical protein